MSYQELCSPTPGLAVPVGVTAYGCDQDEAALFRQLAPRYGVSATVTDAPICEDTVGLAAGNRSISVGHKTTISNRTLLALRQSGVRYVSTRSIGYNHVDLTYAASVGVFVENVTYSAASVADYTLLLMLMAVRTMKSVVRRSELHDYRLPDLRGRELRDLTVGVIGTGRIGSAVMDRLRGFGCQILAYDNRPGSTPEYVGLDQLLRHSDVVTLHTPLTADTHHLLDRDRIEHLKPGAYVVNTGRGALLDTEALLSALEAGRLGGAALDVLEAEDGVFYTDCRDQPVHAQLQRLQRLPTAIVTPHIAYYTDHALSDLVENSIVNCLKYESRKQPWVG